MAFATAILIAVLILYLFAISRFKYSWDNTPAFQGTELQHGVKISIIIAFRNESGCLPELLNGLANQSYPSDLYEVILVDDFSDDGSQDSAKIFCDSHPQFRYVLNSGRTGKKQALSTGILLANHNLVVTTDADCTVTETWISSIAEFYGTNEPDLVIGLVDMLPGKSFFSKYEQASFLSLVAAGSGAACAGRPVYCNGANLAFRKDLYHSLADSLHQEVPSGDDTFLLHAAKKAGSKIMLMKSPDTVVTTRGVSTWKELLRQRARWTSKAGHYRDLGTIYTAVLVLAMNLSIPVSAFMALRSGNPWVFVALFSIKAITDYRLLNSYMRFLSHTLSPVIFILFSLLYPFEVILSAIAGLMFPFKWKGRKYRYEG